MTAGLAGMIAVSALVPALAHAATVPVSGRITAVAVSLLTDPGIAAEAVL
jgi:predicted deacylase